MNKILELTEPIQPFFLGERVFALLQRAILRGELSPGTRLNDIELARRLGVSRSPVRDALKRLEYDGLIVVHPRRGSFVVKLTKKQVQDILEVRESLEGLAVRLAVARLSDKDIEELRSTLNTIEVQLSSPEFKEYPHEVLDFHAYLVQASQNDCLGKFMQAIHGQSRLIRFQSAASRERSLEAHQEHLAIFEAIAKRDPILAEERMRIHLENAKQYVLKMFPDEG